MFNKDLLITPGGPLIKLMTQVSLITLRGYVVNIMIVHPMNLKIHSPNVIQVYTYRVG